MRALIVGMQFICQAISPQEWDLAAKVPLRQPPGLEGGRAGAACGVHAACMQVHTHGHVCVEEGQGKADGAGCWWVHVLVGRRRTRRS